jgi:hypothetical protein
MKQSLNVTQRHALNTSITFGYGGLWLAILLSSGSLLAQDKSSVGEDPSKTGRPIVAALLGHVLTSAGQPVVGAIVFLQNLDTSQQQRAESTGQGSFQFTQLPAGEYRLQVVATGYKTFLVPKLPLVAGDAANANAILEPGDLNEVVIGSLSSVTSRAGTALAGKSVSDLPENQRNFVNLVQVSSGANEGSTNSAANGSRPGAQHQSSAVSIGGQSEMANNSMIDGVDNNERINSIIMVHPSVDDIDTVQIFASAYPASMGQAGGAVINVISKSGADMLHGSTYEFFRNDFIDAAPYQFGANNRKPKLRQNQFGGSLGGPFMKNLRFFADYEGFRLIQGYPPTELTVPTAYEHEHPGDFTDVGGPIVSNLDPAGRAYFSLYPVPNVAGSVNQFVSAPIGSNLSHAEDARLDAHFRNDNQLFGRMSFNLAHIYIPGQLPAVHYGQQTIQAGGSLTNLPGSVTDTSENTVLSYSHSFRRSLLLNLTAGYTFMNEVRVDLNPNLPVNEMFGQPNINLPSTSNGLAPVDVVQASPLGSDGYYNSGNQLDNVFQYGGMLSWTRREHTLSAGSTLIRRQWTNVGSGAGLGMWTVQDLPSLLEGTFSQVYREVDLVVPHFRLWDFSAYIQDEWKLSPRLALSLGLRQDLLTQPTEAKNQIGNVDLNTGKIILAGRNNVSATAGVKTDHADIAPRFGFDWEVRPSLRLRGGYGLVYFRPVSYFVFASQPFIYTFGVCSSQTCPGGYTTLAAGFPLPAPPNIANPSGVEPDTRAFNLHSSAMNQFNLGVEQQLSGNTLSAFYVSAIGQHIGRTFNDINAPPPNTSPDPNTLRPFYAKDPNLTSVKYRDSEGYSSYSAMQARFSHSFSKDVTANVNYTFAHALDNVSAGGFGTVPSRSSTLDYGNSGIDIRHRIAATVFYDLPFGKTSGGGRAIAMRGWQINLTGVWSTGLPFTVLNANDVSNTNPGASAADRSDQIGNPLVRHPSVSEFFNTNAFQAQPPGTLGTERGNQLYGPRNRHLDGSVFKNMHLDKRVSLQIRAEVFNIENTANFASPNSVLGGANFGQLTQLTAGYSPREVQLATRLSF